MSPRVVRKRFELRGHDAKEVEHRLELFRDAVRMEKGTILDIQWVYEGAASAQTASVLYQVPLGSWQTDTSAV